MTENNDDEDGGDVTWPAAAFAKQMQQFQEASQEAVEQQTETFQKLMSPPTSSGSGGFANLSHQLGTMSMGMANFKTRVQSGGRISIPDAEREALDIEEGDIVQTIVIPIKRNRSDNNE